MLKKGTNIINPFNSMLDTHVRNQYKIDFLTIVQKILKTHKKQ